MRRSYGRDTHVLFLGYPDLLIDEAVWPLTEPSWSQAPKRKDAAKIWEQHGRPHMADTDMVETRGIFEMLGGRVTIGDAIAWGGEDIVLDLNQPAPRSLHAKFDLIVDPGTLEHCFNVAQAFDNVDRMLRPGGYVYHQAAAAFPNHGLWSISPTAFVDFYEWCGYELGTPYRTTGTTDANGFSARLGPVDAFEPVLKPDGPWIGSYVFRKRAERKRTWSRTAYPTQRCYSGLSRTPATTDFIATALGDRAAELLDANAVLSASGTSSRPFRLTATACP